MKEIEINIIKDLFSTLFPINRSITGDGFRESLDILSKHIPIKKLEYKSGKKCFDWEVPQEWNIKDAWVKNSNGDKIINFKEHNLHILGYSEPINKKVSKDELMEHIYTLKEKPNAIPYRTSYYKRRWGFCVEYEKMDMFIDDEYEVFIDSELKDGSLTIGECFIKGESEEEVLLTTYMCHPSMANNELSGPITLTMVAKYLLEQKLEKSYRILFMPETIGSIVYLSDNYKKLQQKVIAGFTMAQVGIKNNLVLKKTKQDDSLINRIFDHIYKYNEKPYNLKKFSPVGGGDQRQFCTQGINLPMAYISRVYEANYYEYHTSLDSLDIISYETIVDTIKSILNIIKIIEINKVYQNLFPYCEPQLGKRGLHTTIAGGKGSDDLNIIKYLLSYCDGENDLLNITNITGVSIYDLQIVVDKLLDTDLITEVK
ncbi:MAG: DUF4910 domain-containing protein [Campylobacterota bacterium]|nr:DUF4910 domain-containing protein [Campylobacterota bacterium]